MRFEEIAIPEKNQRTDFDLDNLVCPPTTSDTLKQVPCEKNSNKPIPEQAMVSIGLKSPEAWLLKGV